MDIKPIRTEKDHARALAELDKLWNAEPGTLEFDRLDVLSTLVEKYEQEHHPIEASSPAAAIRFRMEQTGTTSADVAALLGGRSRLSDILHGKRQLSMRQARKLHTVLGIPAAALLAEPKRRTAKSKATKKRSRAA